MFDPNIHRRKYYIIQFLIYIIIHVTYIVYVTYNHEFLSIFNNAHNDLGY